MHNGIIANLKEEFKAHPENYPEQPGSKWRIVLCESDGTPIKKTGTRISPANPRYEILLVANGLERTLVTFALT